MSTTENKTQLAEASTQKTEGTQERLITIIAERGKKVKIPFGGSKWAELKELVQSNGFDLSNQKCVESINKHTLEHPDAIVPDGDFALFLMPLQSKAGGMSRAEINEFIKQAIEKHGNLAKDHFNSGGTNYTRKKTSELADLVESWVPGTKRSNKLAKAVATNEVVDIATEAVDQEDILGDLQKLPLEEKVNFLLALGLSMKKDIAALKSNGISGIVGSLQEAAASTVETEEQRLAREKEEADRLAEEQRVAEEARLKKEAEEEAARKDQEETDRLLAEMNSLSSGFSDVKRGNSRR